MEDKTNKQALTAVSYCGVEDCVDTTLRVYGLHVTKALAELKSEDPNFGRYKTLPGEAVEAQYIEGEGITYISPHDSLLLEARLKRLTGDSNARLIRTNNEWLRLLTGLSHPEQLERLCQNPRSVAHFESDKHGVSLRCKGVDSNHHDWLDGKFREGLPENPTKEKYYFFTQLPRIQEAKKINQRRKVK